MYRYIIQYELYTQIIKNIILSYAKIIASNYRKRCAFLTPPEVVVDFLAAFVAICLRGALPPVDLRAVCLVRAICGVCGGGFFNFRVVRGWRKFKSKIGTIHAFIIGFQGRRAKERD